RLLPALGNHARRTRPVAGRLCAVAVHGALCEPGADPNGVPPCARLAGLRSAAALVLDRQCHRRADHPWRRLSPPFATGDGPLGARRRLPASLSLHIAVKQTARWPISETT